MFAKVVDQMKDGTEKNVSVLQDIIKLMVSAKNVNSIQAIMVVNVSVTSDSLITMDGVKNVMYLVVHVKDQEHNNASLAQMLVILRKMDTAQEEIPVLSVFTLIKENVNLVHLTVSHAHLIVSVINVLMDLNSKRLTSSVKLPAIVQKFVEMVRDSKLTVMMVIEGMVMVATKSVKLNLDIHAKEDQV